MKKSDPIQKNQRKAGGKNQARRIGLLSLGWIMIIISPIVGAIPGPGFIILFPIGLALVVKNSILGKKLYVRFRNKFPQYNRWSDWALRRKGQKEMPELPPVKEQIKKIFKRPDTK